MALKKSVGEGVGKGELYTMLTQIKVDLNTLSAAFLAHRHSVAGAASTGTAPSTEAAAAGATASTADITFE